ncbi:MAG: glycosyltransferase family 87 protein [Acidobacteriota bacterium]
MSCSSKTQASDPDSTQRFRRWFVFASLAVGAAILIRLLHVGSFGFADWLLDDFVAYWSAGRLLLEGQNPYDYKLLSGTQQSVGWNEKPHVMLYPPWALILFLPFGAADYPVARFVWLGVSLGLVVVLASHLWQLYGGKEDLVMVAWFTTFAFYPTLYLLRIGQVGALVLLGVVLFLNYVRTQRFWLAGLVLPLAALKPHLLYLFWIAVGWWILKKKRWTVLGGLCISLLFCIAIPLVFNPHFIQQSGAIFDSARIPVFEYDTPTIGTVLRKLLGREQRWIQFLPMIAGGLGFWIGWMRGCEEWDWRRELPVLIAVSLWTSLYSWVGDLILLLPMILHGARLTLTRPARQQIIWGGSFLGLNFVCFFFNQRGANDFAFTWICPLLIGTYLILPKWEREQRRLTSRSSNERGQSQGCSS